MGRAFGSGAHEGRKPNSQPKALHLPRRAIPPPGSNHSKTLKAKALNAFS